MEDSAFQTTERETYIRENSTSTQNNKDGKTDKDANNFM